MMGSRLFVVLMGASLAGCSGNSLIPAQQEEFIVDSLPVGASVKVLGEAVGQTPMSLSTRDVFPQNFAHDRQHLYGRVEIRYPGCEPFITTVSSRVISDGIKANLNCSQQANTQDASNTASTAATISITLKQRLKTLKGLYEEGLISERDYAEKRRELLKDL